MKRFWKTVLLLTCAVMLTACLAVSAAAYSETDFLGFNFKQAEGFSTVITGLDGRNVTADGVLDTSTLCLHEACEYVESYSLLYKGREILSADLSGVSYEPNAGKGAGKVSAQHGWYSAEFDLDGTRVCFLTGLTGGNLLEVEEELVASKLENRYFAMTNVDFIDAEKNYMGDSQLCWAASTSDILEYTGWGRKAGFGDADDLLEAFAASYNDEAGNPIYAIEWFFNGINCPQDKQWYGWAWADDYDGSFTGYLPDYDGNALVDYINIINRPLYRMDDAMENLRDGYGVSILIGWYYNGMRNGGHLISLWGYIEDTSAEGRERYPALIVSDSDSDIATGADRRDAPNRYRILMADPYNEYGMDTYVLDYAESDEAILEDFCCLVPYSADIKTEKDGTKNKFTSPDLMPDGIDAYFVDWIEDIGCLAGLPVTVKPYFYNHSTTGVTEPFSYTVEVFDADGTLKSSQSGVYTGEIAAFGTPEADPVCLDALDAGEYTVTVTVNADGNITEAYTSNNSVSYTINVVESEVDTSGASVTLGEPYYSDVVYPLVADVTYIGLDTLDADYVEAFLFLSYLENGKWSPVEYTYDPYNSDELPETCVVEARGDKVKAILLLEPENAEEPFIVIQSEPVDAVYDSIAIVVSEDNTWDFADIDAGDTGLKSGEKIAFTLNNVSTAGNDLEYNLVEVYAANETNQFFLYTTAYGHYTLKAGESSEELVFTEFRDDLYEIYGENEIAGEFMLKAVVIGPWGSSEAELGTIYVQGSEVIFYDAFCEVDGISAAFEVTAYVPYLNSYGNPDGNMRVYYEDEDGNSRSVYMSNYEKLGRDTFRFYMENSSVMLQPETTYSFYPAFYSYSEGYSYGYDQGGSFETESLDALCETLWLDETVGGVLASGEKRYYSFTPDDGGAYVFTLASSNYANLYYLNEYGGWDYLIYAYSYDDPRTKTLSCEAGETLYLYVVGSGEFSLTVSRGKDYVTSFSAPTMTLSNDEYFCVEGTATAEVPLGASFDMYIDYGAEDNYETYYDWFTNYSGGAVSVSVSDYADPGESISMRARLIDTETDTEYTGKWQSMKTKAPDAVPLTLGKTETVELENRSSVYYTFKAPADGTYFTSIAGPDGSARIFIDKNWESIGYSWDGSEENRSVELEGGKTYYIEIAAFQGGDYAFAINRYGVATGKNSSSGFSVTMNMTAVVPDTYSDYVIGVECSDGILLDLGTPGIKTLQTKAAKSGEVTETFTVDYCPGTNARWRAFMRNTKTGEEYVSSWDYLGGWMSYDNINADESKTVTAEDGSGFFRFNPQKDNLYFVTAIGEGGVLLRWNPAEFRWEESEFSSGSDGYFSFEPTYYRVEYMAGPAMSGYRAEYFRLIVTSGESANISVIATQDTSSSVATGSADAQAFSAELGITAQLGYHANVKLGAAYGIDADSLNYVWGEIPEASDDSEVEMTVSADTLPGTKYVWRAVGYDGSTGRLFYGEWKEFTTSAAGAGEMETMLLDTLTDEKASAFYTFTAQKDGIYTLTASGENVTLTVCGKDGLWRTYVLDAQTRTVSFDLKDGDVVRIKQEGSSRLLMTNGFAYAEFDSSDPKSVKVNLIPDEDGLYIVAAYAENGKQLVYELMQLEKMNFKLVELSADEAVSYVKIFKLNSDGFTPKSAAVAIAAPQA